MSRSIILVDTEREAVDRLIENWRVGSLCSKS